MWPNIYVGGKAINRLSLLIDSGLYVTWQTSNCVHNERYREFCIATSHLTGETINRFTHIHQTESDLSKEQKVTRLLSYRMGGCIQWCMGIDVLNTSSVVTYEMDQTLRTICSENFLEYLAQYQEHDIVASCVQADVKGDRTKRSSGQADPDMYLCIVETRPDRIIVGGARSCNSSIPYVNEIVVAPTRSMGPSDRDYVVPFVIPADWEGTKLTALSDVRHKRNYIDALITHAGDMGSLTIFGGVFVPNDRIFMNGHADPKQTPYAGLLALMLARFHRHSYTGCKPATSGVLVGMSTLAVEYSGIEKQSHVEGKPAHIIGIAEAVFACGIASTIKDQESPSGAYISDETLANAGRKLTGEEIHSEDRILADLAGGLIAMIPMEVEYYSGEVGGLLNKYIMRSPDISVENVHRCSRMVEDQVLSEFGDSMIVVDLYGGGPPVMEEVAMMSRHPLEELKGIAKYLTGIEPEIPVFDRQYVAPRKMLEKFAKYTK